VQSKIKGHSIWGSIRKVTLSLLYRAWVSRQWENKAGELSRIRSLRVLDAKLRNMCYNLQPMKRSESFWAEQWPNQSCALFRKISWQHIPEGLQSPEAGRGQQYSAMLWVMQRRVWAYKNRCGATSCGTFLMVSLPLCPPVDLLSDFDFWDCVNWYFEKHVTDPIEKPR
jgi:hypothetical protein